MDNQYSYYVNKDSIFCDFDGDHLFAYRYYMKIPTISSADKDIVILMMNPSKANVVRSDSTVKFMSMSFSKFYKNIHIINISPILDPLSKMFDSIKENFPKDKYINNIHHIDYLFNTILKDTKLDILVATGNIHDINKEYYKKIINIIKSNCKNIRFYTFEFNESGSTMHYSYLNTLENKAKNKKQKIESKDYKDSKEYNAALNSEEYKTAVKQSNCASKYIGTGLKHAKRIYLQSDNTFIFN